MNLMRTLQRKVTSDRLDNRCVELAYYGVSLLVLVLGFKKLSLLKLNEAELFFGVLLVLTFSMLAVCAGLIMGLRAQQPDSQQPSRG